MRVDPSARSVAAARGDAVALGSIAGEELRRWLGRGGAGEWRCSCAVGDRRIVARWAIYAVGAPGRLGPAAGGA
ncbi:MAG: hypothetical protein RL077_6248 [Verrucomicrobiota bacterium]|jgi:hypothetical protein